jgi:hypothetical protein
MADPKPSSRPPRRSKRLSGTVPINDIVRLFLRVPRSERK